MQRTGMTSNMTLNMITGMIKRLRYLSMELKKTAKLLPAMLAQIILLISVLAMVVFGSVKSMGWEALSIHAEIAVVVGEDSTLMTGMLLRYVENMESVSQFCDFRQTTEQEGFALLEKGEVTALVLLPEGLLEGIMNGTNPVVEIYFPKQVGLEALFFREMTEAGEGLLRVAQAQIYGAGDMARAFGLTEQLSQIEVEIDSYNLAFALDRLALYDSAKVSAFGSVNAVQFYLASGSIMFLLLAGMAMYPVVRREPPALCRQLERAGMGEIWQSFCQWLCGLLCISLFAGVLWAAVRLFVRFGPQETVEHLVTDRGYPLYMEAGLAAVILMTVTTLVYLIHSLAGSRTGGILLVFLLSVVTVYLSGGLVPAMFLPQPMRTLGAWLPSAWLIRAMCGLWAGRDAVVTGECVVVLCGYTVLCGGLVCALRQGRARRRTG